MKALIGFVVALVLLQLNGCQSKRAEVLAEVSGQKITADEFTQRFESYLRATGERDNIVVRKKILTNMVNELLIFEDVKRRGWDSDSIARDRFQDIAAQAILDGYARRLTTDSLTVSESELWKEFRDFNTKVNARYVYARSEHAAWQLKRRLEAGESFARLAREVFDDPDLANTGGSLGYIGWGEAEAALQEAAFALPVGGISDPIKLRVGYGIIKVENRVEAPLSSEIDYAKKKPDLEREIRQRKTVANLKREADKIQAELSPKFHDEAVQILLKNWDAQFGEVRSASVVEQAQTFSKDFSSLEFVQFTKGKWTVGEFLEKLRRTRTKDRRRVKDAAAIKDVAIGLAIREVLLDRASEAKVDKDTRVKDQIKNGRGDFLLRRWASSVEDAAGSSGWDERSLRSEFELNKDLYGTPPEANVAEILVRSESQANDLLVRLRRGASFGALARSHSIRISAAKQGGEIGFMPRPSFGNAAEMIFAAKVGQVIGPLHVRPYFGLYKILGFKQGRMDTFEEAREKIIQSLLPVRKREAMAAAMESLRANASIVMNIEALGNVVIASP